MFLCLCCNIDDPYEVENLALDTTFSAILQELIDLADNHVKQSKEALNHVFQINS